MTGGKGHPLPASNEARHGEIPEGLAEDKGRGDDSAAAARPGGEAVNPDGEPYPSGDRAEGMHGAPRGQDPRPPAGVGRPHNKKEQFP